MKFKQNGFTLIELIMVIVILGILSAVITPRFFDISIKAHESNEKAVIGAIESGLELYKVNALTEHGHKAYPQADWIETDGNFHRILDKSPEKWEVQSSGANNDKKVKFVYTGVIPNVVYMYECPVGTDSSKYSLTEL